MSDKNMLQLLGKYVFKGDSGKVLRKRPSSFEKCPCGFHFDTNPKRIPTPKRDSPR